MESAFKFCPTCGAENNLSAQFCQQCGAQYGAAQPSTELAQTPPSPSYVSISLDANGNFQGVEITVKNKAEAKLALKELKLKKKEFALRKREINEQQRIIRANYTHDIRGRGSKLRGGGTFGRIVRVFQTTSRDSARANLANNLAPYERQKQYIEAVIAALEKAIMQLETAMLRQAWAD